jgi:hypothetical protein
MAGAISFATNFFASFDCLIAEGLVLATFMSKKGAVSWRFVRFVRRFAFVRQAYCRMKRTKARVCQKGRWRGLRDCHNMAKSRWTEARTAVSLKAPAEVAFQPRPF